ncbi:hypothetical protein D7X33_21635 [Butyricicoccus sp. 1XD8-22]|nr:hypothetical protein D7X33_21635 [Butyricicoccus sp. 1XD8-22]
MSNRKNYDIKIFFDESGKSTEKLHLMGAISIPLTYYERNEEELNGIIQSTTLHWTTYNGYKPIYNNIKKLLSSILQYSSLLKMNVISYDINKIEQNSQPIKPHIENVVDRTIYTKFPERVVYGLVRKYGKDTFVNAEVFIEHDTTYEAKEYDLKVEMLHQLNIQSIYRNENFKVSKVDYLTKQSSYGIELTDLLLGIVRTIIQNESPSSKRSAEKHKLVMELINDSSSNFLTFAKSITLFEWNGYSNELKSIPFEKYLDVFISSNLIVD